MFDQHKTKAMTAFLAKEGPNGTGRVVGLSIEDDGVFIYTDSAEWCDCHGAGTFRDDTETKAIKRFYERVERGDGNRDYPQPESQTGRRAMSRYTISADSAYSISVNWQDDVARYHIWVDEKTGKPDGAIYKNCLAPRRLEDGRDNPDHWETRELDPDAKANAQTMAEIRFLLADGTAIKQAHANRKAEYAAKVRADREKAAATARANLLAYDGASQHSVRALADILDDIDILKLRNALNGGN